MLTMYPACFFKEENGYSVVFPDLEDGCLGTCGKDLEEAIAMAIENNINFSQVLQEALLTKLRA